MTHASRTSPNLNAYMNTCLYIITKTRLFKYIEKIHNQKLKVSDKNSGSFDISAQNIDCGYSLEPPHRGGSNECPQSIFLTSK